MSKWEFDYLVNWIKFLFKNPYDVIEIFHEKIKDRVWIFAGATKKGIYTIHSLTVENCNKSNLAYHETTFIFILAMSRSKQNDLV